MTSREQFTSGEEPSWEKSDGEGRGHRRQGQGERIREGEQETERVEENGGATSLLTQEYNVLKSTLV